MYVLSSNVEGSSGLDDIYVIISNVIKLNVMARRNEIEILRLVALGSSNADIARRLALSEHTVKRHVANILTRLGLKTRAAAAAHAARLGLL